LICFFFFFQAEDGIRDFHVTGVQTCALPILRQTYRPIILIVHTDDVECFFGLALQRNSIQRNTCAGVVITSNPIRILQRNFVVRSEERRVGKECRYWWWPSREMDTNSLK